VQRGRQEEMDVKPGELARAEAEALRALAEPALPFRRDTMMAHVRRIAGEERPSGCRTELCAAVIVRDDAHPSAEAGHVKVRSERGNRDGIELDGDELRRRKPLTERAQESTRPRTRVDDTTDRASSRVSSCPIAHGRDDCRRRVHRAALTPHRRRAQDTESITQRIATGLDLALHRPDSVRIDAAAYLRSANQRLRDPNELALGADSGHQRSLAQHAVVTGRDITNARVSHASEHANLSYSQPRSSRRHAATSLQPLAFIGKRPNID
jgi:hypothetical protein